MKKYRQILILETGSVVDTYSPIKHPYVYFAHNVIRTPHTVLFQVMSQICKSPLSWRDTTIVSLDDEKFSAELLDVSFNGVFVVKTTTKTSVEEENHYYKFENVSETNNKIKFKFETLT